MNKEKLKSLIREIVIREESGAAKKAKAAGLIYAKFGRWKDPKTNKVVALSRGDELEKVTPKEDKPKKSNAAEKAAVDFLSKVVKASKWKGKVYLAGGYVRDELLGRDPKDIDLVVEFPDGGIKFAEWLTKKLGVYKEGSNPVIYPKFGTAALRLPGKTFNGQDISDVEIEVVMTRKEQYTKGSRKPKVSHGTLGDDVERRDFTVNSLLKDLTTGEILDLTGMGKADLKKGIVRTPLNPDVIFTDDPLRMLRAIRFTVKYDWQLPRFMIKALKRNSDMLKTISAERIQSELSKMLVTKHPDKAIRLLQMTGLNKHVAPELDVLRGMKQNKFHKYDVMKHTLAVLKGTSPKLVNRLAALFHDIGKGATKEVIDNEIHFYKHEDVGAEMAMDIMKRLKYPTDIIKAVTITVQQHMRTKQYGKEAEKVSDKALRKLKADLGDHLEDTLDIIHSDNLAHADDYNMPGQVPGIRKRLKKLGQEPAKPQLPISGNDIMTLLDIKPSKHVGQLLNLVKDAWFENPKMSRAEALELVMKAHKEIG